MISASGFGRRLVPGASALVTYAALSIIFFGRTLFGHFATSVLGHGSDPTIYIWCFEWWSRWWRQFVASSSSPVPIGNPWLTHLIWVPEGINLAWTTSVPAAATAAAAFTERYGSVIPYNVVCLACPALAGWAAFELCRYFSNNYAASILGGYLYGFSPYMLGQTMGHMPYQCVFIVPLIALLVIALANGKASRWFAVPPLAAALAIQFGLAIEIFATMTFFGAIAYALWFAFAPTEVRARLRAAIVPIALSYLIAAGAMWSYLWNLFASRTPPTALNSLKEYSADLLNFIIPTTTVAIGNFAPLSAISSRFTGNVAENGAYFSPFLILVIALWLRDHLRQPAGRLVLWIFVTIGVAALGPRLHVAGWIGVAMPWKLIAYLPLIRVALPVRFALYGFLVAAVVVSLWLADSRVSYTIKAALAALIVASIFPNPSSAFWGGPLDLPAFFTHETYRSYLKPGEIVVPLPFGIDGMSMAWQAESRMYFRMAGGYLGATPESYLEWPIVDAFFNQTAIPETNAQLLAFMQAHGADAIILDARSRAAFAPILDDLGVAPLEADGILLYRIPPERLAAYANVTLLEIETRAAGARFSLMLVAASRYIAAGGNLAALTPYSAQKLGLLPPNWVKDTNVRTRNGLFLGPMPDGAIGVGINGTWPALKPVIDRFGPDAREIRFPYPRKLDRRAPPAGVRMMVMVFDRSGLAQSSSRIAGH